MALDVEPTTVAGRERPPGHRAVLQTREAELLLADERIQALVGADGLAGHRRGGLHLLRHRRTLEGPEDVSGGEFLQREGHGRPLLGDQLEILGLRAAHRAEMLQLFFGQADGEGRGVSEMVVAFTPYGAEKQLALAVQVIPCLRTCSHIQSLQCNIVYGRNGHAVDAGSIQNEPLNRGRQARPHARKGRHAEEPFPGRGKQRIGSGVPRFRLLAVCCRSVTFIHDVDLELHAFLKAAARRHERGRPRVQDQHRRKPAPQPGPCILVRLSLKRRYGLCSRRFPERLEQFENRVLNLHRRAAHGVTPSHGRVPGSSNTAPGVSVPAGGRPGMPALPSATSRSQLSALV